jgi:hypothetical protein
MSEKKSLKDLIGPIEVTPSVTKQSSMDGTTNKKSLKDLIGPIEVTPSVTKQSSVDGTTKIDDEGAGLRVGTKYGNLNISKNKNTQSYSQDPSGKGYTSKYKGVSYDKEFKTGKNSRLNISANVGKTEDPMGKKGTTKGGTLSFTKQFNEGGFSHTKPIQKKYYKDIL